MKNYSIIFLLFLVILAITTARGQTQNAGEEVREIGFARYLIKKNKLEEARFVLQNTLNDSLNTLSPGEADSMYFLMGVTEVLLKNENQGIVYFDLMQDTLSPVYYSKVLFVNFVKLQKFEEVAILKIVPDSSTVYYLEINRLQRLSSCILHNNTASFKRIFESGKCTYPSLNTIEFNLYIKYLDLLRIPQKKQWKAIMMSAIIPGLGKAYAGKKREAVTAFLPVAINAVQAYEGFNKKGFNSVHFYVFGSIGGVFYFSNLYGTKQCIKRAIDEKHEEIYDFVLRDMANLSVNSY